MEVLSDHKMVCMYIYIKKKSYNLAHSKFKVAIICLDYRSQNSIHLFSHWNVSFKRNSQFTLAFKRLGQQDLKK